MTLLSRSSCLVLLLLIPCLTPRAANGQASDAKSVRAIGKFAGTDLKAQDEARNDAKRNAVKAACGEIINAQTQVEDFAVKRDRILSDVRGYLVDFHFDREWVEDGVAHCEIAARVATGKFTADWKAMFEHLKEDMANPRCVIVILEDNDMADGHPPKINGVCQSKLENFFLSHNVQLMDKGVSEDVRARDVALAAQTDDVAALAHRAAEFKAEVLVLGRAEARYGGTVELAGRPLQRWDVTLNVRVVQADSAQILTSNTYRPSKAYSTMQGASGDGAFEKLVEEFAPKILGDVASSWKKGLTTHQIFRLTLEGLSRSDFRQKVAPALMQLRNVQQGDEGVKMREAVNETVSAEIYWSSDLNALADALEDMSLPGMQFRVKEQSGNRLTVSVVAKP